MVTRMHLRLYFGILFLTIFFKNSIQVRDDAVIQLCGQVLTNQLKFVCRMEGKRYIEDLYHNEMRNFGEDSKESFNWHSLFGRKAKVDDYGVRERLSRQISNECCLNPCTIRTLKAYCY